jgi:hypothetical protein
MARHLGDEAVSQAWKRRCNHLIKRIIDLFPETFASLAAVPFRALKAHLATTFGIAVIVSNTMSRK